MALILLGVGAVLCLAGTRAALAPFVAAGVAGAATGGTAGMVAAWAGVAGAGLVVLGIPVRRLAIPAAGVAGVAAAAAATNAGTVLLPWLVGSGAALGARGAEPRRLRRWGAGLLASDLVVAGAVVSAVLADGFAMWPPSEAPVAGLLLVAGGLWKAALAGGPADGAPETGIILVRAQAAVLLVVGAAAGDTAAVGAVLAGSLLVAGGPPLAARAGTVDAVQELGLFAVLAGGAGAGWVPGGWLWVALGAGTFLHLIRAASPPDAVLRVGRELLRAGGFGSVLLPAAGGALAVATAARGPVGAVVVAGLGTGLVGRSLLARGRYAARAPRWSSGAWGARVVGVVGVGIALAVPLVPLAPVPEGGAAAGAGGAGGIPWPGLWALALTVAGGALGALRPRLLAPARPPSGRRMWSPRWVASGLGWIGSLGSVRGGILGAALLLAVVAIGLWAFGWTRGFL